MWIMIKLNNKIPITVKKTVIHLETLAGVKYSIPKNSFYHLIEAHNRVKQKLDGLIIITGSVGSGKSNKAKGLAGTWENYFFNREYTLDNVHFSAEKVSEQTDRDDNKTHVINFDEAIQGGGSSAGITKVGKVFRSKLITKRFKRHLYLITVDSLKELNDKLIERCVVWYHVYYKRDKHGKYNKGFYKVFNPTQALKIYEDLKDKRCRDTMKHTYFIRNRYVFRDNNYDKVWYSEDDYDAKKSKETSEGEDAILKLEPKHIAIFNDFKDGVPMKDLAKKYKVSKDVPRNWVNKVQDVLDKYALTIDIPPT